MRIGLFGGTFNPIHSGHLDACRDMIQRFCLDRLLLVPAAVPPHKSRGDLAEVEDRMAMIRLAAEDVPGLEISDIEISRFGPSYTVDTLRAVAATLATGDELFLIMGLDAFLEFHTWKRWQEILRICCVLVMNRPGEYGGKGSDRRALFDRYIRERLGYVPSLSPTAESISRWQYVHPEYFPVTLTRVDTPDISSSLIRRMVRLGQSIDAVVPEAVVRYIQKKGLYR
jgi:nicotinate-nucleotide adenylyltransferase